MGGKTARSLDSAIKSYLKGWSIAVFHCADDSYYVRIFRKYKDLLFHIKSRDGIYLSKHPERYPLKLVLMERGMSFREAYSKYRCFQEIRKPVKRKLVETKVWPLNRDVKDYYFKHASIDFVEKCVPKKVILDGVRKINLVKFWKKEPVKIFSAEDRAMTKHLKDHRRRMLKKSVAELMPNNTKEVYY